MVLEHVFHLYDWRCCQNKRNECAGPRQGSKNALFPTEADTYNCSHINGSPIVGTSGSTMPSHTCGPWVGDLCAALERRKLAPERSDLTNSGISLNHFSRRIFLKGSWFPAIVFNSVSIYQTAVRHYFALHVFKLHRVVQIWRTSWRPPKRRSHLTNIEKWYTCALLRLV
jgi:hypothetical protein